MCEDYAAYIYLIQDGNDIGTNVYKIGKTKQNKNDSRDLCRLRQYSHGTKQHATFSVPYEHVDDIEDIIIREFKSKYKLARGREWFEGNMLEMREDCFRRISQFLKDTPIKHISSIPQGQIQNQQNLQTQNNNVTSNVVVKYPGLCDEEFDFDREHISIERLNTIWDCTRPEIGLYKYASAILENPKNRYVKKRDVKANHSFIHVGDGKWELALDKDVFPRLTFYMSVSALGAYNDNKKNLKLVKTNFESIFDYLDNVNTNIDPDFTDALQRLKLILVNQTKKWEATA